MRKGKVAVDRPFDILRSAEVPFQPNADFCDFNQLLASDRQKTAASCLRALPARSTPCSVGRTHLSLVPSLLSTTLSVFLSTT